MKKREYGMVGGKRRNVYVSQEDWESLKVFGSGNASQGIRRALYCARRVEKTEKRQKFWVALEDK